MLVLGRSRSKDNEGQMNPFDLRVGFHRSTNTVLYAEEEMIKIYDPGFQ